MTTVTLEGGKLALPSSVRLQIVSRVGVVGDKLVGFVIVRLDILARCTQRRLEVVA